MTVVHHLISLLMRAERHPGAPLCWGWEQVAHAAVRMQLHVSGSLKTCSGNTRVSWAPLSWGGGGSPAQPVQPLWLHWERFG